MYNIEIGVFHAGGDFRDYLVSSLIRVTDEETEVKYSA